MWANETEQHSPPLQPPKVSGLLSRNLAGKCCCNCHKYFSLSKFIFVCLILIIFPCVHALLALLTNLASRKLAGNAALTLIFLACHIISCSNHHINHQCVAYRRWADPLKGFTAVIKIIICVWYPILLFLIILIIIIIIIIIGNVWKVSQPPLSWLEWCGIKANHSHHRQNCSNDHYWTICDG